MENCIMLMCLLFFWGLPISQGCNQKLLKDVDFPGSDITFLYSVDVEHCQQLCTEHSSCQFFTFVRADSNTDKGFFRCFLKSTSSGKPNHQNNKQGLTSGFSLKTCNPKPKPQLSKLYHHVDFLGADYKALFTPDAEECQRVCTNDPGCQFFTFIDGNFQRENIRYKCHLKFSWTIPRTPHIKALADRVSGFSQSLQTSPYWSKCETRLFPNIDVPGHDFDVQLAASPEQCLALCSAHPRCTFFSYVSSQYNCYLKSNTNEMTPKVKKNGITSGIPARFCQLDNSWIRRVYVGLDFYGSDIRNLRHNTAAECQKSCTDDPNCQFYSYVTSHHRCYLKRVITVPNPPTVNKLPHAISGFTLRTCE